MVSCAETERAVRTAIANEHVRDLGEGDAESFGPPWKSATSTSAASISYTNWSRVSMGKIADVQMYIDAYLQRWRKLSKRARQRSAIGENTAAVNALGQ